MTSSYRRCCCGGGTGVPGGGYCEYSTLVYQAPIEFGGVTLVPATTNAIPKYLTLTLPESLDLSMFRDANCGAPLGSVALPSLTHI